MSSKRSRFSRQAELRRCIRLANHYAERRWVQREIKVRKHIVRMTHHDIMEGIALLSERLASR